MENESNQTVSYVFQKVKRKINRLGLEFTDEDIYDEIDNAFEAINSRRHFIPTSSILIEEQYKNLAYELCIASMVKEGAEGESLHSENGISRKYDSESILKRIVPLARIKDTGVDF